MKLRLRGKKLPIDEVRRLARRELGVASSVLSDDRQRYESVHTARKQGKKVRALLRLVRKRAGAEFYRKENRALRDLGRKLSVIRDAQVVIANVVLLRRGNQRGRISNALKEVQQLLTRTATGAALPEISATDAREIARGFARSRRRVKRWPIEGLDWPEMVDALVCGYRRNRAAMNDYAERSTLKNLHRWRKRAKEFWYQLLILEAVVPRELQDFAGKVGALTELQGAAHDLDLVLTALDRLRDELTDHDRDLIRQRVQSRIRSLAARALKDGRRIFLLLPERFAMRLRSRPQ